MSRRFFKGLKSKQMLTKGLKRTDISEIKCIKGTFMFFYSGTLWKKDGDGEIT